jgi:cobalamin-dependent methionine synthase-like protein
MEKIEQIPLILDLEEIKKALHIKRTGDKAQVQNLLDIAKPLINAMAVYKISYLDERLADTVIIEGIRFKSGVLRKNLDKVGRVFPHVVTIGMGIEERVNDCDDLLEQYYLDMIGNIALIKARKYLESRLLSQFGLDQISYMSPGSLEDWPLEQQRPLFSLLGDVEGSIGVKLNKSLLMIPGKSVSGVYFPKEVTFYSCQLCPRERCEGRKALYTEELAREYGILK